MSLKASWVMRCSRSAILPTISLKLAASRASSSSPRTAHLDMLARRQPPGGFVEPRERLGDAARRAPRREGDEQQAEQRHDAKRELELARVGQRLALG